MQNLLLVLHLNDERGLNSFIAELSSVQRTVAIPISLFRSRGVAGKLSQMMILLGLSFNIRYPALVFAPTRSGHLKLIVCFIR